jgi:hypothetical protein
MKSLESPLILLLLLMFTAVDSVQATSADEVRNLATLQEKWNLTANGFAYEELSFSLDYITSDFILDNMMGAEIYDSQCQEGGVLIPSTELSFTLVPDSTAPGAGDNERNVAVDIVLDPNTISNSATYSEQTLNGEVVATVNFCMRFSLSTNTVTPIEVNFLETIVTLTIDLTDGFSIGTITVQAKDIAVRTASQAYQVEGYQCDLFNEPLSEAELASSRNQGSILRVCVRPDQTARDDGIYMKYIDSFAWQRDYGGVIGVVIQPAVENREAASNRLTNLYCTSGDEVCAFESILFAAMFRTPGAITGNGIASMQFGNDPAVSRRNLRQSSRALQEEEPGVVATAEFQLDMEVIPVRSPYLDRYKDSAATSISSWISLGITLFVCMVCCVLY